MLYNIDLNVINECKKDVIKYKEFVILNEEKIEVSTKFSSNAYKNTNWIGTFNLKTITFETENIHDFKNKIFDLFWEVNGIEMAIGTFITTEIKDSDSTETVKITACDFGLKFAVNYETELNYLGETITLQDVLNEICTNCEVEVQNATLPNYNFGVDGNQFENMSCGDVISQIAGINGMFATINNLNKLEFIYSNKDTNIIIEDYIELEDKRDTKPINSISVGFTDSIGEESIRKDQNLINLYGENWLRIEDNRFAYSIEKQEELIDNIFNNVKGFGYSAFVCKNCFYPFLTIGDKIQFRNKDGNLVSSIVHKIDKDYAKMTISALSVTSSVIDYLSPGTTENIVQTTKFSVDRALNKITQQISELGNISTTLTGSVLNATKCANSEIYYFELTGNIEKLYPSTDVLGSEGLVVTSNLAPGSSLSPSKFIKKTSALYPEDGLLPLDTYLTIENENGNIQKLKLPISEMNYINETKKDIFKFENKRMILIKNIGVDYLGNKYELQNSTETDLGEIEIILDQGSNLIKMESYTNVNMKITYLNENDYTQVFSTKVETSSKIELAKAEISLEVSQKTDTDELISKINLKPGQIDITGTTTINENFKVLTDGSIEAKNGKFSGDILLNTGGKVLGTGGLLTNIIVPGTIISSSFMGTSMFPIGYSLLDNNGTTITTTKDRIEFKFTMPKNFIVQSAYIYIEAMPVKYDYRDNNYNLVSAIGYCRNFKLYKSTSYNSANLYFNAETFSPILEQNISYGEILNAFGSGGFTGSGSMYTSLKSGNIVNFIDTSTTESKFNILKIETANATVSSLQAMYEQSGGILATLVINGYTNFE